MTTQQQPHFIVVAGGADQWQKTEALLDAEQQPFTHELWVDDTRCYNLVCSAEQARRLSAKLGMAVVPEKSPSLPPLWSQTDVHAAPSVWAACQRCKLTTRHALLYVHENAVYECQRGGCGQRRTLSKEYFGLWAFCAIDPRDQRTVYDNARLGINK
jgi:hypothetical protein